MNNTVLLDVTLCSLVVEVLPAFWRTVLPPFSGRYVTEDCNTDSQRRRNLEFRTRSLCSAVLYGGTD
jgi:hypothetical protein